MDKLNHGVAVKALNDIQTEAAYNVNSGDIRVAGESRRDYLFATILSQLLSTVDESTFNNVELAKLPTPDELAASSDPSSLGSQLAGVPVGDAPVTPQPQTADQLADQSAGVKPVEAAPETSPLSPAQPPVDGTVTGDVKDDTTASDTVTDTDTTADPSADKLDTL